MSNNKFGVMDVLNIYPDLAENFAKTNLKEIMKYIGEKIDVPNIKTDILILAGGGHEYFARESGIRFEKNTLYSDPNETFNKSMEFYGGIENWIKLFVGQANKQIKQNNENSDGSLNKTTSASKDESGEG